MLLSLNNLNTNIPESPLPPPLPPSYALWPFNLFAAILEMIDGQREKWPEMRADQYAKI
ncbi:unnamed protein product [Onchocerca flexuosa]|uniref:UBIQUITIN_CONJUGAT_2 domain-containing protein n=1 Tax=Onchocerca flexuosa TaxID=387005 RepID=A0A183I5V6_9BILA|nr:unnamed protein product [Onchocerca flexuosa]